MEETRTHQELAAIEAGEISEHTCGECGEPCADSPYLDLCERCTEEATDGE